MMGRDQVIGWGLQSRGHQERQPEVRAEVQPLVVAFQRDQIFGMRQVRAGDQCGQIDQQNDTAPTPQPLRIAD